MGKKCFKRLLLKLILVFQIYYYLEFEAEARETQFIPKSFDGIKANDGDVSGSNDKIFEKEIGGDNVFERQKRPYRLLPLKMIG